MKQQINMLIWLLLPILGFWGCEPSGGGAGGEQASVSLPGATTDSSVSFVEIVTPQVAVDLADIRKRGRLVALTGYSANTYFIYKGETLGFEYELLNRLAEHLQLELEIVVVRNLDHIFSMLNEGKGDIIAYNMTITRERRQKVAFTDHHTLITQVLVQRKPPNWRNMKLHEIDQHLILNPVELIGKRVYVRKQSSYYHRLQNLADEIGGEIDIVEVPGDVSTEELIKQVDHGEIDFTVADENVAQINAAYYQNVDIRTDVSLSQRIGWAVRKNSPELRSEINRWLRDMRRRPTYNILYDKYHKNQRFYKARVKSEFFSQTGSKISPYDDEIKRHADSLRWDWRLLAAQIYQESQFDPQAVSWAGARGLMQLMPRTAEEFGARKLDDPVDNMKAGTSYLRWLFNYWKSIPDSLERIKFVLASYNAGQGHVEDARRLTSKFRKNPDIWDSNVAEYMLLKAKRKYFNDRVVQYGYCRGEEPVNYVADILARFGDYQKLVAIE